MISLNWGQVNTWRLSQQGLKHRLEPEELVRAVKQTLGIHAQVMTAAEMAIAARVEGLMPQDMQSALWQEPKLVKTWAMRQTLHLIPADDFSTYVAARRITDLNWPELFKRQFGVDKATFEAYLAVVPEILTGEPITRQQFAQAVGERLNSPEMRAILTNPSWGVPFKPLAWHGELCFGPGNGQSATFVRPRNWIGSWQDKDPESAMKEIVRRYLQVYGPARPRNFQVWWWMSGVSARKAFDSIADETEQVDVEGWRGTALKESIRGMMEVEPTGEVYLLPPFDAFTVGLQRGKDLDRLIALKQQKQIYRPQGWVSAVVIVDGYIIGTWDYKAGRSNTSFKVNLFTPGTSTIKEKISAEADQLGRFLNHPIVIEFSQP